LGLLALAAAGCGGSQSTAASQTTAEGFTADAIVHCVVAGGGHREQESPILPKGFPKQAEMAGLRAQEGDVAVVYVSRQPVFNESIARGVEAIHEFEEATVMRGGRALMMVQPKHFAASERKLVVGCVEP
jgi:hypothetical protein